LFQCESVRPKHRQSHTLCASTALPRLQSARLTLNSGAGRYRPAILSMCCLRVNNVEYIDRGPCMSSRGGSGRHPNTWFHGPTHVYFPDGISVGSAVLRGSLINVPNIRLAEHATSVAISRILLLLLLLLLLLRPFNGLFSRTTSVSRYQKSKTSLDLNEARDDGVLRCSGIG